MNWLRKRKLKRLVQAKLGGQITSDQESALNRLMEKSGFMQDDLDRLMAIENQLNQLKAKDAQIDVSTRVMQAILKKEQVQAHSSLSENALAWFFGMPSVRFATAVLVGILLGSAITWTLMTDGGNLDKDMLRGSLINNESRGISFMQQNIVVKMIPYMLDNLHYLNFVIDSPEEIHLEIGFNELDFMPRKSDFIELQGAYVINTASGSISFAAKGRATALLILEKVSDDKVQLRVGARRNNVQIFNKQIFFD